MDMRKTGKGKRPLEGDKLQDKMIGAMCAAYTISSGKKKPKV
jgi:hypothetical protein